MTVTGSGTTPTPFGYVGQGGYQGDSDTGLMLCGHRYYDSSTGRFLSRDPAMEGYNWYNYCDNSPVTESDPLGLAGGGVTVGGSGYIGVGPSGSIGTGWSGGAGLFSGGWGAWGSGDAFANWGDHNIGFHGNGGGIGAYIGASIGLFFTNAEKASDMAKTTKTITLDGKWCLGGGISFSYENPKGLVDWIQHGIGVWSFSITVGPGYGGGASGSSNGTATTH